MRDDIIRHLERLDRLPQTNPDPHVAWLIAAIELLLRAELQRQAREDGT